MFIRFSRYRFKEGNEAEGLEILRAHAEAMASSPGCERAWVAQGQHPATEFIVIGEFRDEAALRAFEGRLRSDPNLGSDLFSLMRLTTQPPDMQQFEIRYATASP